MLLLNSARADEVRSCEEKIPILVVPTINEKDRYGAGEIVGAWEWISSRQTDFYDDRRTAIHISFSPV